ADLPLPDNVEDLLGMRVDHLGGTVRRVLLSLALQADLRVSQLTALAGVAAVDESVAAGVAGVDGERVRPAHPLLAEVAKNAVSARERRQLHLELANVVADEDLRDLHRALAARGADEDLAGRLMLAASAASARGAVQQAVVLGEQ